MLSDETPRNVLLNIFRVALKRVDGARCVARILRDWSRDRPSRGGEPAQAAYRRRPGPPYAIAIGKAASAMMRGALEATNIASGLVITKHGHAERFLGQSIQVIEAGHPVPDAGSLEAGQVLLHFLKNIPAGEPLIFLVSGGASSLVEVLPKGVSMEQLAEINAWLLGSGLDISQVNRVRKALSCIKAGRLAALLDRRPVLNLLLSDVPGDDPRIIGSGLLVPHKAAALELTGMGIPAWIEDIARHAPPLPDIGDPCFASIDTRIVASNVDAVNAAMEEGRRLGLTVFAWPGPFKGDAVELGRAFVRQVISGPPGLYIWGGESTVRLPSKPGRGGRNQSLALAAAGELDGKEGIHLLAAGTDGTDGPTEDAGAVVDGATVERGAIEGYTVETSLSRADAGSFLQASGDILNTGPTGTNVMDLVLALKTDGA